MRVGDAGWGGSVCCGAMMSKKEIGERISRLHIAPPILLVDAKPLFCSIWTEAEKTWRLCSGRFLSSGVSGLHWYTSSGDDYTKRIQMYSSQASVMYSELFFCFMDKWGKGR